MYHTRENEEMILQVLGEGLGCRVKSESVGMPPGLLATPTNRDFGTLPVTYEVLVDDPNHLGLRPEISRTVDRYLRAEKPVQISLGSDGRLQYSMVD